MTIFLFVPRLLHVMKWDLLFKERSGLATGHSPCPGGTWAGGHPLTGRLVPTNTHSHSDHCSQATRLLTFTRFHSALPQTTELFSKCIDWNRGYQQSCRHVKILVEYSEEEEEWRWPDDPFTSLRASNLASATANIPVVCYVIKIRLI